MNLLPTLLISLAASLHQTPFTPTLEKLEKLVIAQRSAIQRGALTVYSQIFERNKPNPKYSSTRIFRFDGDKRRVDIENSHTTFPGAPAIYCQNCEKKGYFIEHLNQRTKKSTTALRIYDFNKLGQKTNERLTRVFYDPRLLGWFPEPTYVYYDFHFRTLVDRPDRKNTKVSPAKWKGRKCWLITYEQLTGERLSIWIDPGKDYSIVAVRLVAKVGKKIWDTTIESTLKQHGPDKIWFPVATKLVRYEDKKVKTKEFITIKDIKLNEPINPKVFTLAGMNVEGWPIRGVDGKYYTIKDGKLQKQKRKRNAVLPKPIESSSSRSWLFWTAGVFGIVSCLSWFMYVRKRSVN